MAILSGHRPQTQQLPVGGVNHDAKFPACWPAIYVKKDNLILEEAPQIIRQERGKSYERIIKLTAAEYALLRKPKTKRSFRATN